MSVIARTEHPAVQTRTPQRVFVVPEPVETIDSWCRRLNVEDKKRCERFDFSPPVGCRLPAWTPPRRRSWRPLTLW